MKGKLLMMPTEDAVPFTLNEGYGPVTLTITSLGIVRTLDRKPWYLEGSEWEVKRASHVEPCGPNLRRLFHALRTVFGEKGAVAAFTRLWPCVWRVNLTPVGGPVLKQVYWDRAEAIEAEVRWLEEHFL